MVHLSNLEELLNMYPDFLDRTPTNSADNGSIHYRVQKIKNNQYNSLRTSIKLLTYSNNLNRPISISKTQTKEKEYVMNFNVNIPHIKKVKIHKIDPTLQQEIYNNGDIFYSKNWSESEDCEEFSISFNETCTTTFPIYQYILTVETWDEHYIVKGYPENDNLRSICFINDYYNDDGTITYNIVTEDLESSFNTNIYDEDYFRFICTYNVDENEYSNTKPEIFIYSKEIEDINNNSVTYYDWVLQSNETEEITIKINGENQVFNSYKIPYDQNKVYCIVMLASDGYFTVDYYPFTYLHEYNIFEHDQQLDVIGEKYNIPRWEHKQVLNPKDYISTEPSFYNRLSEDDSHYCQRIIKYMTNYGEKYLPELEIWKEYGLPSILTNRKNIIASQCDTYMWTDCCTDNDNIIKNKTSINLLTDNLTCHYNTPKQIKVRVTCEDNESIYDVLDGFVEYRFNGENHYARVQNGYATLNHTLNNYNYGTVPLQIQYTGYDEYDESNTINTELTFKGKPVKLTMSGTNYSATRRDSIQLQTQVKYQDEIINDGIIEYYHNGTLLCAGEVKNNKVNIRYTIPDSMNIGVNNITAIYTDDRDTPEYDTTSITFKLNVLKERLNTHIESILFYPHGFSFRLHDSTHETVENQILYIYEEDKEIGRIKTYSQFYSTYYNPELNIDFNKKYYVEFRGSQSYNPIKARIYPVPKPVYKETHFVTLLINNHFAFKLHDGRDNTLWDKNVTVRLNGTLKGEYTTKHDWVWVSFNEHIDETDQIKLTFNGDEDYNPCTGTFTQIAPVSENETNIRIIENNYHTEVGEPVDVYVQLLDKNNTPLTDYEIYFYHRDEILPDTFISKSFTDEDGITNCTFTPYNNKKTYIKCEFKGNTWYDKSTNLAKIFVGAGEEAKITTDYNENKTYKCLDTITVHLTNLKGESLSNRKVNLCEHHTTTDTSTGEDIGNDIIFNTTNTDKDGYANIPLKHKSGTFTLSATFNGDDEYKACKTIIGEINLTKRNMCMTTYPSHGGTLHSGTNINTHVYDCENNDGINGIKVYYYFKRISTGAYQNLTPVTTTTNSLEQDGYAYHKINYADGDYLVGVTLVDPNEMYNNKSSIYENFNVDLNNQLINTTEWENNKYLYPIHITSEGKIQTSISLSNETITSGEDMVATLIDETGNPLSGKTVYFRNADNLTFATVVTDKFGHARQTFNMAEVKNKIMYYGWESDDDLYEGVENVAHITINRRSLCFVENNINADDTVPVGFIYKNRLVDCRDYSNGLVDTADYGRSMYGKVVSIIFERFKKDTMESLGKSAPYYILINREDGRFEFPINLAPSGVNGEYHYTFELNYDYDLNDREYRNIDGYYNDKQTYPIKFYTETVEDNSKKVNMSLSAYPSEVSKGTQYTLTCHLAPSTEAINEGKTVNNIKGYVLFKTEQGAYLNKDNPTVVNKGIASFVGIDNATSGQDFIINAEFISTDVLMFNDCESTDTVTITTIEEGENSNKNTKTTITDITPNSGATGDTFTVTTTVVTRNNNENIPNGTITLTGFDGNIVETGTITDGIGTISATVPNVLKKTYTDLIVEYKGEGYNASSSTPNQFTVTASPISGDRYNISWQKEIDNEITSDEAENYEYTVYLINTSPTFYDPSGQVEVYLDGVYIETLNIINMGAVGKVTSTINLNDGESNHLLRFEYLGDDYFLPSTTSHLIGITQTSNQTTTPTISINGTNNITSGDNYDVTITVTGDATNGAPTGTITLDKNNNSNIYNLQLTPTSGTTSTATFTESSSGDTSTVKFRAYYNSGDTSKYTDAGYSDYFNVTITSSTVTKANSSISLTGTSPISQGTNYTLTATVTGNSTTGYPTGNVELYKGGNKLDTASLSRYNNSSSKVTFTPSSSGDTGTKTFKAKYLGNTVYNSTGYSDNVNIQVEQPTTLTMSNYTIKSGTTGTVQAILTDNNGTRLSGKTVNIQIAGVTYSMTSVGNGVYEKTINMTGNRNGTMKATFNGETGVYQSSSSKTCSIIIYQNRVGYGNLWVLYPDSFSKGSALNFYVVDSNQNPLSGYPVSIKYTRINTSTTYPWSDTTTQNTAYTGLVSSATVSYDWSNATLQFNVTFNSSIAVVSMGEGGSLSNLPNGNSVTFNVSYNPS